MRVKEKQNAAQWVRERPSSSNRYKDCVRRNIKQKERDGRWSIFRLFDAAYKVMCGDYAPRVYSAAHQGGMVSTEANKKQSFPTWELIASAALASSKSERVRKFINCPGDVFRALSGCFYIENPLRPRINGGVYKREEKGILLRLYVTAAAASWAHSVLRPANKAIKTMEWPLCVCVRYPFFGALIQNSSSSAASGPAGRPAAQPAAWQIIALWKR